MSKTGQKKDRKTVVGMTISTTPTELQDALVAIERAEAAAERQLEQIRETKETYQKLIGVTSSLSRATVSLEYQKLGPVEAAERLLRELSKPMTTREIVDGMIERGWTTRSRNATATVYATLANAKKKFRRDSSGHWVLTPAEV